MSVAATTGKLAAAESWMVDECRRLAGGACRSIESGPGDWSDGYLKRLLKSVPAVRVAFLEAPAHDGSELTLDTSWVVYVLTGWQGPSEQRRRHENYALVELLAPWLHNAQIPEVGLIRVAGFRNMWTEELDEKGLALFAIMLGLQMDLDPDQAHAAYGEFLHAGVTWDLPDAGDEDDAGDLFGVRQEEDDDDA